MKTRLGKYSEQMLRSHLDMTFYKLRADRAGITNLLDGLHPEQGSFHRQIYHILKVILFKAIVWKLKCITKSMGERFMDDMEA